MASIRRHPELKLTTKQLVEAAQNELTELREHCLALKAENEKLRRILAHVPATVAIKAKEDAGYPEYIRPQ